MLCIEESVTRNAILSEPGAKSAVFKVGDAPDASSNIPSPVHSHVNERGPATSLEARPASEICDPAIAEYGPPALAASPDSDSYAPISTISPAPAPESGMPETSVNRLCP